MHVWRIELDRDHGDRELPPDERERAANLQPGARRRWIAARRALRLVLGRYLGEDPARIVLRLGSHGKPALAPSPPPLHFNLSHSADLALLAVTLNREVGVDIERIQPDRKVVELARIGLDSEAAATVRDAPPLARTGVFHDAWVRREAIAKCLGVGLGAPLPPSPVAVTPIGAGRGYAAAVAIAAPVPLALRTFALGSS
ncbi:MAG TPA: 4'-phosphopantetheinyl transferase superfamily protein [Solirubrobacterales bacterium]|nr:4'-phosphopantetheinyl transferase superfamily protein [Solirubrobacterales bacterium]